MGWGNMTRSRKYMRPRNRIGERPLPGITPQCCPMCDEPTMLLGQYEPTSNRYWICADCSRTQRYPVDMLIVTADGDWTLAKGITNEQLAYRVDVANCVHDAVVGRRKRSQIAFYKHLMVGVLSFIADLPEHLQVYWERQLTATHQWVAVGKATQELSRTIQLQIPLCERCGCSHNRRYEHGYTNFMLYCQKCDDELSVEAFFNHKGIFGDDDDEQILDRIYRSHREVFERGVLPTYWYELKQKKETK